MNKYQEALKKIWKMFNVKFSVKEMEKAIEFIDCKNALQELIDNYSTMEEQVKTCEHSADKKIEQLEKALDKAIDELIEADGYILCGWNKARYTKDQWKEYLLKESEKQ